MEMINTCLELATEFRPLALYSHALPATAVIILGVFTLRYARNRIKAILFFTFTILLSLWLIGDLVTWYSNNYYIVAAFWAPLDYLNVLFYLVIFFFLLVDFFGKEKIHWYILLLFIFASALPFLLTFSGLSVHEFDEPNCEMIGNDLLAIYKLILEWTVIIGILIAGLFTVVRHVFSAADMRGRLVTIFGVVGFLSLFSGTEYLSTFTGIYEINLYALFALPFFLLLLTYNIVEQKIFNLAIDNIWFVRLLFLIFLLVGISDYILVDTLPQFLVTLASTIVTLGFGLLLLRTAARESTQRKKIESLALELKKANDRLQVLDKMKSEFVSIASHQLRSPLTAIRGYTSMLLEGSYGTLSKKASEAVERIAESSRFMAMSIEDYLNVSRIESGNMKYDTSDFNLKKVTEALVDEMRPTALKRGLLLVFRSDCSGSASVHADVGKVRQAILNLIDNAIKYTEKGSITVIAHDDVKKGKMYVTVQDTGVGMDHDTLEDIFDKFVRAKNANKVNVTGTGLGLYVARKIVEKMNGRIWAESKGQGKGSTFHIELPLLPGKEL